MVLFESITPIVIVVSVTLTTAYVALTILWHEVWILYAKRLQSPACRVADCYAMLAQWRVGMSRQTGCFATLNCDRSPAIGAAILKNGE